MQHLFVHISFVFLLSWSSLVSAWCFFYKSYYCLSFLVILTFSFLFFSSHRVWKKDGMMGVALLLQCFLSYLLQVMFVSVF